MAQTEKDQAVATDIDDRPKDSKGGKVADYLAAPRKKRKSYVLMALGKGGNQDLAGGIDGFLRTNYKGVAISAPKTAEELYKNFSRQIVLLIFDDEFMDLDAGLEMIQELKRRKNANSVPVLFLTRQPERLINSYNKILAPFHELDDYVNYANAEMNHIFSKIRHGLVNNNRRRSRRYKTDLVLKYYLLSDDQLHNGRLVDLSIHGGMLKSEDGRIFKAGDQLKLHVPVAHALPHGTGDFLKLSAKVQRVFIDGTQAGVSFEHVSEQQMLNLTRFLTEIVNEQASRRPTAHQGRSARP